MKCKLGCNQEGIYQYKNGYWYCSKYASKCPETRRQNKLWHKDKIPFQNMPHPRGMLGKKPKIN